jgi:hypothetical protein
MASSKTRSPQDPFPADFTRLVAEVMDISMKAIVRPDPAGYIQAAAASESLQLRQLDCAMPERRDELVLAAAMRCDQLRGRIARELAVQIVESYGRLRRAEETILQTVVEARRQPGGSATTH